MGADWGAVAGWHLSLLRPDRVRALVALCVPYFPRNPSTKTTDYLRQAIGDGCHIIQFQVRLRFLLSTFTIWASKFPTKQA